MEEGLVLLSGNSNRDLALKIASYVGIALAKAQITTFSDGEIFVEIEENVRGKDAFIIQSTCYPANTNLMELLIMVDTLKRASAERITTVIPYYGYARQDRKVAPRTPITARLVADLLTAAGVHRILCLDLHAGQIQGFFNIPVDHLYASPILVKYVAENFDRDCVIVSPDAGGVERARTFAKKLGCPLAIVDKRRIGPNVAEVMNIIGDVRDKKVIILDDIIDTAGTITQAAQALYEKGAEAIYACCTHPVLSGKAMERIQESVIKQVVVTDTIPLNKKAEESGQFLVLTVSELLGEAIKRIHDNDSVTLLFI